MKVISLFSGCGGLDLGFTNAGFKIVYANDFDKATWETFEKNHHVTIDRRSICDVQSDDIPNAIGIIGGPPCQSWSLAGAMRGALDVRGQLFYEYIRVINDKKPKFFLAENVPGLVSSAHILEFNKILSKFKEMGYDVSWKILDARDYGVPQERKRVIIVGYHDDLGMHFEFPSPTHQERGTVTLDGKKLPEWVTLKEAIGDLPDAKPAMEKNHANRSLPVANHEYMTGGFSTIYMSRNRLRDWDEQSYTIQAGGRHAPLYPSSAKMRKVEEDWWEFVGKDPKYRRLSVREAARIQTFPDTFVFYYDRIEDGYKMVGNAVPVKLAEAVAKKIKKDLLKISRKRKK